MNTIFYSYSFLWYKLFMPLCHFTKGRGRRGTVGSLLKLIKQITCSTINTITIIRCFQKSTPTQETQTFNLMKVHTSILSGVKKTIFQSQQWFINVSHTLIPTKCPTRLLITRRKWATQPTNIMDIPKNKLKQNGKPIGLSQRQSATKLINFWPASRTISRIYLKVAGFLQNNGISSIDHYLLLQLCKFSIG